MDAWRIDELQNVGLAVRETARRMPDELAVACPAAGQTKKLPAGQKFQYDTITFSELEKRSNQLANGLKSLGITQGVRVALMVPPGIDFVCHVFALYKTGAVTILIDPGMGRKNMIKCLAAAKPEGIVGIRKAQLARWIFRSSFRSCRLNVSTDGYFPWCQQSKHFLAKCSTDFDPPESTIEHEAAIIFTTGSTGPPKGVLYRHRNFIEQAQQIRDYFQLKPGSVDVSGFPLFALFNAAMGTTTVFPEMDATRPAEIYPPNLIDAVNQFNADQSFGSPALWNTVSKYCIEHQQTLPTIRRVLTAGAPVPPEVLASVKRIIAPDGDVYTPYGATEALPVACNSATEVLGETAADTNRGKGTCVGHRFERIQWKVIRIDDGPLKDISQTESLPQGEIGELMVQGPAVTDQYVTRTEANADHKVADGDSFWHRMGDVGYLDPSGRFWFCGRKAHRVQAKPGTMFTVPCEAIINTHEKVYRSALLGLGSPGEQTPVIVVEPYAGDWPTTSSQSQQLIDQIKSLASQHELTMPIQHVLLKRALPVDIRHNSKIFREQLRPWAKDQLNQ
ncbi:MAG: fatty acid CoA ligase family protein [Planctomycetota bacterium]